MPLSKIEKPAGVYRAALFALIAMVLSTSGGCLWFNYKVGMGCLPNVSEQPSPWDILKAKADRGDVQSQYDLGRSYANGYDAPCATMGTRHVNVDHTQAYFWFTLVEINPDTSMRRAGQYSKEAEAKYLTYPKTQAIEAVAKGWEPTPPEAPLSKTPAPGADIRQYFK